MNSFLRGRLGPTFVVLLGVAGLVYAQQPVSQSGTWTITATDLDVQSGGADILSTTAFNAAFGTAGTADTQVLSVQGIASMTALQVTPSTAATWGIYAEDSAHSSTQAGLQVFGVRQDSQVDFGADGDYVPFSINDAGELRVAFSGAAGGTSALDDADIAAGTTPFTPVGGFYQSTVTACTDGDGCMAGITAQRTLKVTLFSAAGAELTPAQDWTASSAIGTTAPGLMLEAKTFDGSALPATASGAEGDAIPAAGTLYGIAYNYLTNTDGSKSPLVDEDVASAAADLLLKVAGIRDDTLDARSGTEGDYEMFHMNANGALWVQEVNFATVFGTDAIFGTAGTADTDVLTIQGIASMTPLLVNPGTAAQWGVYVEDAGETVGGNLMMAGAVVRSTASGSSATAGDNATFNVDGLGRLWIRGGNPCQDHTRVTTAAISTAASGNVEIVALNGSDLIYVCGYEFTTTTAQGIQWIYGTGTACATGETDISGVMEVGATGGIARANAGAPQLVVPAGNAFCVEKDDTVQMSGYVTYVRTAAP